jgi:hypothetical protein
MEDCATDDRATLALDLDLFVLEMLEVLSQPLVFFRWRWIPVVTRRVNFVMLRAKASLVTFEPGSASSDLDVAPFHSQTRHQTG